MSDLQWWKHDRSLTAAPVLRMFLPFLSFLCACVPSLSRCTHTISDLGSRRWASGTAASWERFEQQLEVERSSSPRKWAAAAADSRGPIFCLTQACVGEPAIVVRSSPHNDLAAISAKPSPTTFENANTHSTNWCDSRQQRAGELQQPPRRRRGTTEVHSSTAGPESCQWHSSLWQQLIQITLIYSCMLPGMTKS